MKANISINLWSWEKQFSLITNYSDDDLQVKQIEIFDLFFYDCVHWKQRSSICQNVWQL